MGAQEHDTQTRTLYSPPTDPPMDPHGVRTWLMITKKARARRSAAVALLDTFRFSKMFSSKCVAHMPLMVTRSLRKKKCSVLAF